MTKTEQTINTALAGVREELARHRAAAGKVSNPDQLERFEAELLGMLEDLRQGEFRPERTGLGHIVADSWPLKSELANSVCAAVEAYKRVAI